MTRQTLLLVTTSYPVAADGSEAAGGFVADFATALSQHIPVRVVGPGRVEGLERSGEIPVWRFSAGSRPLSLLSPSKPWHWPAIAGTLRSLRKQVLAADSDSRIAHTLALWALPSGWAARSLQRANGVPYSVWALGSDIWSLGRLPIVDRMLARVCRDAVGAYADGLQLARDGEAICGRAFEFMASCRKLAGVRESPVRRQAPYRLLYLGRWHRNKGIDLLLDALDSLDDRDWKRIAEVHIAGGGPFESMVHARAGALRSAGRPIRVSGFLDRSAASAALAQADRLLLPSRVESIPVVLSDALAYRLPVVSMPVGDLPALLSTGAGWLSESVQAPAFAGALRASLAGDYSEPAVERLAARFNVDEQARVFVRSLQLPGNTRG